MMAHSSHPHDYLMICLTAFCVTKLMLNEKLHVVVLYGKIEVFPGLTMPIINYEKATLI